MIIARCSSRLAFAETLRQKGPPQACVGFEKTKKEIENKKRIIPYLMAGLLCNAPDNVICE
jgi:hypothetical protein